MANKMNKLFIRPGWDPNSVTSSNKNFLPFVSLMYFLAYTAKQIKISL